MTIQKSDEEQRGARSAHVGRYILIGFLTVAPLWVTWLVFDFLLNLLARIGDPLLKGMARAVRPFSDTTASWLLDSNFQHAVAALLTVVCMVLDCWHLLLLARKSLVFTNTYWPDCL